VKNQVYISAILLIASAFFSLAKATSNNPEKPLPKIAIIAEKIASKYYETGRFSGSLLLAKDGQVFFERSYGYEDKNEKRYNSLNTKFALGSIVKNYTKVLILQQVELGKLSLNDTIDKYELGFPTEIASKVTIQHLLNHRAGFGDIFTAQYRENQLAFDTLEKKLALLINEALLFHPDTDYRYSNYGYIILGVILEKITNQSFEDLLNKNIFERIDLQNTSFKVDTTAKHQSTRYSYLYDGSLIEVGVTEHSSPDGGIESTVKDVQKFYRELFYGISLLDRSNPIVKKAFAMSGEHWGAFGGGIGVSAAVEVNLAEGIEVIVLANTDKLVAEFISGRIQSFIKSGSYEEIRPLEVNYAYDIYKKNGKEDFYKNFQKSYEANGYTQFIGRTINELGMQLLKARSWKEALDIFGYLVSIFPDAPQVYDSLAFAYLSMDEQKKAQITFQKALEIKADFNSDYVSDNYVYRQ
jgi:CubicO group peptidase (beta-lactamase class C family)